MVCSLSCICLDVSITRDIRQYLSTRFTKNSVDSELQHQIRENLHMRVVPCKWRARVGGGEGCVVCRWLR